MATSEVAGHFAATVLPELMLLHKSVRVSSQLQPKCLKDQYLIMHDNPEQRVSMEQLFTSFSSTQTKWH